MRRLCSQRCFALCDPRSFALSDYLASNITVQLANPNFQTLLDIVAPISYADILSKIPKFIISASGDEFGLPDDILLYWDKFRGEKRQLALLAAFLSFLRVCACVRVRRGVSDLERGREARWIAC